MKLKVKLHLYSDLFKKILVQKDLIIESPLELHKNAFHTIKKSHYPHCMWFVWAIFITLPLKQYQWIEKRNDKQKKIVIHRIQNTAHTISINANICLKKRFVSHFIAIMRSVYKVNIFSGFADSLENNWFERKRRVQKCKKARYAKRKIDLATWFIHFCSVYAMQTNYGLCVYLLDDIAKRGGTKPQISL